MFLTTNLAPIIMIGPTIASGVILNPNILREYRGEYRIKIFKVALNVCYVNVPPTIVQAHKKVLVNTYALYLSQMTILTTFRVDKGHESENSNANLFWGKTIPSKIYMCMVETVA